MVFDPKSYLAEIGRKPTIQTGFDPNQYLEEIKRAPTVQQPTVEPIEPTGPEMPTMELPYKQYPLRTMETGLMEPAGPELELKAPTIEQWEKLVKAPQEWSPEQQKKYEKYTEDLWRERVGVRARFEDTPQAEYIMSRAWMLNAGIAAPFIPVMFETLNQLRNVTVAVVKKEPYSFWERRSIAELLPEDTPSGLKIAAGGAEWMGDIALVATLRNLANEGLLIKTLNIIGAKMQKAGYDTNKVTVNMDALKNFAKRTTVPKEISRLVTAKKAVVPTKPIISPAIPERVAPGIAPSVTPAPTPPAVKPVSPRIPPESHIVGYNAKDGLPVIQLPERVPGAMPGVPAPTPVEPAKPVEKLPVEVKGEVMYRTNTPIIHIEEMDTEIKEGMSKSLKDAVQSNIESIENIGNEVYIQSGNKFFDIGTIIDAKGITVREGLHTRGYKVKLESGQEKWVSAEVVFVRSQKSDRLLTEKEFRELTREPAKPVEPIVAPPEVPVEEIVPKIIEPEELPPTSLDLYSAIDNLKGSGYQDYVQNPKLFYQAPTGEYIPTARALKKEEIILSDLFDTYKMHVSVIDIANKMLIDRGYKLIDKEKLLEEVSPPEVPIPEVVPVEKPIVEISAKEQAFWKTDTEPDDIVLQRTDHPFQQVIIDKKGVAWTRRQVSDTEWGFKVRVEEQLSESEFRKLGWKRTEEFLKKPEVKPVEPTPEEVKEITIKSAYIKELKKSKLSDITGLPKKEAGERILKKALESSERTGVPTIATFLDVDNMKQLNEKYSHAGTDKILKIIGDALKKTRGPRSAVYNPYGDEFLHITQGDPKTAEGRMNALIGSIKDTLTKAGYPDVNLTGGHASKRENGMNIKIIVDEAEAMMMERKPPRPVPEGLIPLGLEELNKHTALAPFILKNPERHAPEVVARAKELQAEFVAKPIKEVAPEKAPKSDLYEAIATHIGKIRHHPIDKTTSKSPLFEEVQEAVPVHLLGKRTDTRAKPIDEAADMLFAHRPDLISDASANTLLTALVNEKTRLARAGERFPAGDSFVGAEANAGRKFIPGDKIQFEGKEMFTVKERKGDTITLEGPYTFTADVNEEGFPISDIELVKEVPKPAEPQIAPVVPIEKAPVWYHQTSKSIAKKIEKEGFSIDFPRARETDDRIPNGVYLKSTKKDISVGEIGKEKTQIPVVVPKGKTLEVQNIKELHKKLSNKYNDVLFESKEFDIGTAREFDKVWYGKFTDEQLLKLAKKYQINVDKLEVTEQGKDIEGAIYDKILNEAKPKLKALAKKARDIATKELQDMGYDYIYIKEDSGFLNRVTDNFIVLPHKIKEISLLTDIKKVVEKPPGAKPKYEAVKIGKVVQEQKLIPGVPEREMPKAPLKAKAEQKEDLLEGFRKHVEEQGLLPVKAGGKFFKEEYTEYVEGFGALNLEGLFRNSKGDIVMRLADKEGKIRIVHNLISHETAYYPEKVTEKGLPTVYGEKIIKGKAPQIFRITEPTTVVNTQGQEITLPKGEEYRAYELKGNKIRLTDGKQLTVYEGELSKLKGQLLKPGEMPKAGGIFRPEKPKYHPGELEPEALEPAVRKIYKREEKIKLKKEVPGKLRKLAKELWQAYKESGAKPTRTMGSFIEEANVVLKAKEGTIKIGRIIQEQTILKLIDRGEEAAARTAFHEGKRQGLFKQKEHYEDVVKRAKERKILAERYRMARKVLQSLDIKHMRPEYQQEVANLIEDLDIAKLTERKRVSLEKTLKYINEHPDKNIPSWKMEELARLDKIAIRDMTVEELEDIVRAVQHMVKLNDLKNMLIINKRLRGAAESSIEARELLKRKEATKRDPDVIDLTKEEKRAGPLAQLGGVESWNAELICDMLDGLGGSRPTWKLVFKGIDEGTTTVLKTRHDADDWLWDKFTKAGLNLEKDFDTWSEAIGGDKVELQTIKLPSGKTIKLTKAQRWTFILHDRNTRNATHLLTGGFAGEKDTSDIRKISPEDLQAIIDSATDQERKVAEIVHEFYNVWMKPKINEVSVLLDGYENAVEPDYYPIRTNALDRFRDVQKLRRQFSEATLEGMGIFKERTNATNAIIIEDGFKTLYRHMKQTSAYIGLAVPLRNAKMHLFNKEFEKDIIRTFGRHYWRALDNYIRSIEDDSHNVTNVEKIATELMGRLDLAILGANPFVAMKQPVSYLMASLEIPYRYLAKALPEKVDWNEITKHSPQLRDRHEGNVTRELGELGQVGQVRKFFAHKSPHTHKLMAMIRAFDYYTIGKVWNAAKIEIKTTKPNLIGEDYMKAVADRAEEVVRLTQPTWLLKDRSAIGRHKNVFVRLLTKYTSQRNKNYQAIHRAFLKYNASGKTWKDKVSLIRKLLTITIITSMMIEGINALRDVLYKRKPKTLGQKIVNVIGNTFSYIYFFGDAFSSFISKARKGPFAGWDIGTPVSSFFSNVIDMFAELYRTVAFYMNQEKYKAGKKKGQEKWKSSAIRAADKAASTTLSLRGIPYETGKKMIIGIKKWTVPEEIKKDKHEGRFVGPKETWKGGGGFVGDQFIK